MIGKMDLGADIRDSLVTPINLVSKTEVDLTVYVCNVYGLSYHADKDIIEEKLLELFNKQRKKNGYD